MSSQPTPVLLKYKEKTTPSAGIVVAVLVTLLILFLWLHFILAQKIESAGREIQFKTEQLHEIERHNHELRRKIAISSSQERLAERSRALGYGPQRPLYLLVDQPLPPTTQTSRPSGLDLAGIGPADAGTAPSLAGAGVMAESGQGE
ncbi:MAG: hypothetical protein P8129_04690 [Anaerolineae bacterium]